MNINTLVMISLSIALGGCGAWNSESADTRSAATIKTEQQFRDTVVGKQLVSGNALIVISDDGKISGVSDQNEEVFGAWTWNDEFFCRNVVVGDERWEPDCQVMKIDGDRLTIIRERGDGVEQNWTILPVSPVLDT